MSDNLLQAALEAHDNYPDRVGQVLADALTGEGADLMDWHDARNVDHVRDAVLAVPVPMVLNCPACGLQHVDKDEGGAGDWTRKPHRSHLCKIVEGGCGYVWRPADVPTVGVEFLNSRGTDDSPGVFRLPVGDDRTEYKTGLWGQYDHDRTKTLVECLVAGLHQPGPVFVAGLGRVFVAGLDRSVVGPRHVDYRLTFARAVKE